MTDDITKKRDDLLAKWDKDKATRDSAVANEMASRKAVSEFCFPSPEKGTQRIALANGWQLKLVHKINYTLDKKNLDDTLDKIEKQYGEAGEAIVRSLIKYIPEMIVPTYEKLEKRYKEIFDVVVTSKPGAPTLEIEGPKK